MNTKVLGTNYVLAIVVAGFAMLAFLPQFASAAPTEVWSQGFETDASGWVSVSRVASGTDGIPSSEGAWHGTPLSGAYTLFDGYRDTWTGEWIAEVDVYLDPVWAGEEGFDYSVAASGSDGLHQRDYIFHVGTVEDYGPIVGKALLVNGSNNADFYTNPYKLVNDNDGNYYEVTDAGWYTLQHVFRDDGGSLAVDLNLIDSEGTTLWTATRTNVADTIPAEVGGNRYGWFTHIDVAGGIAIDASSLAITLPPPPDPTEKDECKKGGWEVFGFKNQGQCVRFVETGKDSRED